MKISVQEISSRCIWQMATMAIKLINLKLPHATKPEKLLDRKGALRSLRLYSSIQYVSAYLKLSPGIGLFKIVFISTSFINIMLLLVETDIISEESNTIQGVHYISAR